MNKDKYTLSKHSQLGEIIVNLPSSKSISNRALIISHLAQSSGQIANLSEARDTATMRSLLTSNNHKLDVIDAGTTMRFLTAYFSATNQNKVLTGSERMCQRPLEILVDALREIGVKINYQRKNGYPPISIEGFDKQLSATISVRGDVSSQYISALLMIAPILPQGLTVTLTGKIGSKPYIDMTLKIMERYGVKAVWTENKIIIEPQPYQSTSLTVEPDWSAASYWFSILALSESGAIKIKNLKEQSLQGDQAICNMMSSIGVITKFEADGILLEKTDFDTKIALDFTHCPDLAQTVAVTCAARGIYCNMTGVESLRIKETDRITALQNELHKIGAKLQQIGDFWALTPSKNLPKQVSIDTYEDHRMAMAFAPLATLMNVTVSDPSVVKKSYPTFWDDMINAGFEIDR